MPDKLYLLIPGAALPADVHAPLPSAEAMPPAPLPPNLRALLIAMAPTERIECGEDSLSMPCEIALARLLGLPDDDGLVPWAAVESGTVGSPCAWIKPCHWRVGTDHVVLTPTEALALDDTTSQELLHAMAPYFLGDGIALRAMLQMPGAWLATGELFRALPTLSMDRAAGQRMTPASLNPGGAGAATLRRLQNEMQMLLYTHPVNEARQRRGLLPINSFWVAGAGLLAEPVVPTLHVRVEQRLVLPAQRGDAAAHAQAWAEVDADACAALLAVLRAGGDARLTLCGHRAAQSFVPAKTGLWAGLKSVLGLQPLWNGREQL